MVLYIEHFFARLATAAETALLLLLAALHDRNFILWL